MADLLPLATLVGEGWDDYGLVDSGGGRAMDELLQRAVREEAELYARYDPSKLPRAPASRAFCKRWDKKNAAFFSARQTDGT